MTESLNKPTKYQTEFALITKVHLLRDSDGIACTKCREWLHAPEWTYDFREAGLVINLWSCMSCGNRFETETSTNDGLPPKLYSDASLAPKIHDDDEKSAPVPLVA
jgi:DNA-directed RNA polymerase subunit RPC12/RpoP